MSWLVPYLVGAHRSAVSESTSPSAPPARTSEIAIAVVARIRAWTSIPPGKRIAKWFRSKVPKSFGDSGAPSVI